MVMELAILAGLIVILLIRAESSDRRAASERRDLIYAILAKSPGQAAIAKRIAETPDPTLKVEDYELVARAERAPSAPPQVVREPEYDMMNADEDGFAGGN